MPANVGGKASAVAQPGDRIVVESEKVGQAAREGEILDVTETPSGMSYEVRWDDGRRSGFRPAAGSARIIRAEKGAKKA